MFRNIWNFVIIASVLGGMISVSPAFAAIVTSANDYPTTLQIGAEANHRVLFTTPSGVLEGETITLTFSTSFDTAAITENDVDVSDDSVDLTTAADCTGAEQASVVMAADVLTITICAGDGGAIAATSSVEIEIGTNATSSGVGSNQIVNPAVNSTYFVTIGGTFGDLGAIALPISATDDSVGFRVVVPNMSSGGGGGGDPIPVDQPPTDSTAPIISNIVVNGVTENIATISWTTNEVSDSAVDYGLTSAFELGSVTSANLVIQHSIGLSGLSGGKTYSFQVRSKDAANNEAVSSTLTFSTLDFIAPVISHILVTDITSVSARVVWTTDEVATSSVEYGKTVAYGSNKTSAEYKTSHSLVLTGLNAATTYHFRVGSTDHSQNTSLSSDNTFLTLVDLPPANVTGLKITAGVQKIDLSWVNPIDMDLSGIRVLECTDEIPSGPSDVTGCAIVNSARVISLARTGLTNGNTYYYGVFAYDATGQFASGAVGSGIPTAAEEEEPPVDEVPEVTCPGPNEAPSQDPACQSKGGPPAEEEVVVPEGSSQPTPLGAGVGTLEKEDLEVLVAGNNIVLSLGAKGTYEVLPGTQVRLQVSADKLSDTVESLQVSIGSETYLLLLADQQGGNALYFADVFAPQTPQLYLLSVTAEHTNEFKETVSSFLNVVPWGKTVEIIDDEETLLSGVKITLSQVMNGSSIVWDGSPYNQFNPVVTGSTGTVGWYVPNGTFRLLATADHFLTYTSDPIIVSNNIVAPRIVMAAIPLLPEEEPSLIPEGVQQVAEEISNIVETIFETPITQSVQKAIQTVRENKSAQVAVDYATPVIAITAGASIVLMTIAFDFIPFLQWLFTAPVLLFWRRKRKGYGVVYNAISRVPIDLAVVRLYFVEDATKPGLGKLVKSRVTDKGGRFFFLVQPGIYRLTATKAGFRFPTDYLKDQKDDGSYLDVYHSEMITVTEKDAVITPNVPLDPVQMGQTQVPKLVVWQGRLRILQQVVGLSGVLISISVALIRPNVLAAGMIAVQICVYLIARRLAKPRKPKSWGIVYDQQTKRPLTNVVARIFEPKYNKLLDTQVTDSKGRYAFLLGPSEYFAVFEKAGYRSTQVRPIDLRQKQKSHDFGVDVELLPSESSMPTQIDPQA